MKITVYKGNLVVNFPEGIYIVDDVNDGGLFYLHNEETGEEMRMDRATLQRTADVNKIYETLELLKYADEDVYSDDGLNFISKHELDGLLYQSDYEKVEFEIIEE